MKFVGRSSELQQLDRALQVAAAPRVAWITGPVGAGKTALARHFAARASAAGHVVQWLACEESTSARDAFTARLDRIRAARAPRAPHDVAAPGDGALSAVLVPAVLVVDGFERHEALDRWLLDEGVVDAGPDVVVVVTARRRVSAGVRTMPDPRASLVELHLASLAPAEVIEALVHAGVPEHDHERGIALTKGHPLTLALVLERFAREPQLPLSLSDEPGILADVVADLLRDAPASEHRLALHALAIAGVLDEWMLARATGARDAHGLFSHLASLSIVERSKHGLVAQSLVRDVLYREHALRNPEEHAQLVSRIAEAIRDRRRGARSADEALRLDCQAAFVEAPSAALRECCDFRFLADVTWRAAEPTELGAIAAQVERYEGVASRARLASMGAAATSMVLARRDGSLAAFAVLADASAKRARIASIGGPEHHAIGRETWTALVALEAMLRASSGTRELSIVLPPRDPLASHLVALGFVRVAGPRDDDATFVLAIAPHEATSSRTLPSPAPVPDFAPVVAPHAASADAGARRFERPAFDLAWRTALPLLHRPHELASSPLIESELGRGGPQAVLGAAREACDALAASPGYADSARVIDVSFIHPAPKQEAAAATLGVPFGTYRYQLRKAIALLLEELWRRETSRAEGAISR
jgi:RecA/RadA recombinase